MPITIHQNADLKLHVVDFAGCLTFAELKALGETHARNPAWAAADTVHIVRGRADVGGLSLAEVDAMRAHYRALHQSISFHVVRRAGWICRTAAAAKLVEYWFDRRHSRDGQNTELCMASDLNGLAPLFDADELEAIRSGRGFEVLQRIDYAGAS